MKAVNLIPSDQRRGAGGIAGRSGGIVYVLVGGLSVVVALGVVYGFAVKSVADRTGQLGTVTDQVSQVQLEVATLQPYLQLHELSQQEVSSVVALTESRFDWPDALRQLSLAFPNDVTLTQLTASAAGGSSSATSTTSTDAGASFSLSGCASSQAEVASIIDDLERAPGVTDVTFSTSTKTNDKAAPNYGPTVARSKAAAAGGTCPLVSYDVALDYSTTYTVPKIKIPASATDATSTISASKSGVSSSSPTGSR